MAAVWDAAAAAPDAAALSALATPAGAADAAVTCTMDFAGTRDSGAAFEGAVPACDDAARFMPVAFNALASGLEGLLVVESLPASK